MKLPGGRYIIKVYGLRPVGDVIVTLLVMFMLV